MSLYNRGEIKKDEFKYIVKEEINSSLTVGLAQIDESTYFLVLDSYFYDSIEKYIIVYKIKLSDLEQIELIDDMYYFFDKLEMKSFSLGAKEIPYKFHRIFNSIKYFKSIENNKEIKEF